jgi:hypothetical protein
LRLKFIPIFIIFPLILCGCAPRQAELKDVGLKPGYSDVDLVEYKDSEGRFTFSYPARYIPDRSYLWLESRYRWHMNNPQVNDERHIPDIRIVTDSLDGKTLDEYITDLYGTSDFEHVKINGFDFIKIKQILLTTELAYFISNNDLVVGIKDLAYKIEDNKVLEGI